MTGALANTLVRLAVDESTPTEKLFAMIPGPIGAFIAVLLLLLPVVSEVKGWTHGPLAKRVEEAAKKAEKVNEDRDTRWADRDRRYEELDQVVETLRGELERVKGEVRLLHRIGDAQNRLLSSHSNWDREAQTEINKHGGNLRPPPPLYVILSEDDDGATIDT